MADQTSTAGAFRAPGRSGRSRISGRLGQWLGALSPAAILDAERDRLFLWIPVAFGFGIAAYFALPREPALAAVALVTVIAGIAAWRSGPSRPTGIVLAALFLAALGMADAALRSLRVAAPVVTDSGGPAAVTGRVTGVEMREDGAARILVSPVGIEATPHDALPRTLSLWMRGNWSVPAPGDSVRFRAVLLPPPDAAVPGGFDYARQAWFSEIGGVGFIVSPPVATDAAGPRGTLGALSDRIERLRLSMAARIRDSVPGPAGAIAAALVTGERGTIRETDKEALRASGLAHILAISGLHMMLVVGTLFWTARAGFAVFADLALRYPIKKWAAIVALSGGAAYLVLSGGSIATQRAFIMASIMLMAVLFDRPAITLRNVAIAAMVVLVLTPEALVTASFQMSFSATVALVSVYEAIRVHAARRPDRAVPPWLRFAWRAVAGLFLTSLVAGLATGPFAVFQFNRVAVYGLVANLAAMPLVSLVVMPMGLFSVVLMPFGLEGPALAAMGQGIDAVLWVARTVSGWDGAVRILPQAPMAALLTVVFGGLWLTLWKGRIRLLGLPLIAVGGTMMATAAPPDLFISRDVRMAALRTGEGLVFLPRIRSDYEADIWYRAAGLDAAAKTAPAARCDAAACVAESSGIRVSYVMDPAAFAEDCRWADVLVTPLRPPAWCAAGARVIGPQDAARSGAMTVHFAETGGGAERNFSVQTAAKRSGDRPWTRRDPGR